MARKLAAALRGARKARLAWEPEANEVFGVMRKETEEELRGKGAVFYPWEKPAGWDGEMDADEGLYRFVTSFATTDEDIERLAELIA